MSLPSTASRVPRGERAPSSVETRIRLKSVSIFAETPDDILGEIGEELAEVQVKAGELIFARDERGDSMYLIVSGRVRVHDGERTIDYAGQGEVFGEMAALDPEARAASVTAVEDTTLYRLDGARFYERVGNRTEVVRGIIHILCQHLRACIRDMNADYRYMQQFAKVTAAAAALEAGVFEPQSLREVAARTDELGQLARVFQRMAEEVAAREERLKQQVQQLRIEIDEGRTQRQVAEITETDYFKELETKADQLRLAADSERGAE